MKQQNPKFRLSACARSVLIACGTTATVMAVQPVFAQNASEKLQRVEVTGSRILSVNAEASAPVQVFSSADIAASGVANVQDLLLKLPVMGTPAISRTNSNFSTSSAGVALVDLRNLGSDRTLILVNGRRYVAGVPGSSAVDLNTIPTDFIERVEVLTGGASSVYGSDAVAGVINIIFKKNFEGAVFDAQVGRSTKGDDEKQKFSATFGANLANGKGNIMGHFSASQQGAVFSRDRDISAVDQTSIGASPGGKQEDLFNARRPFYSGFAPQGRFFHDTGSFTYDEQGNPRPFSTNGSATLTPSGFNRSEFRTIAIPTERALMALKGDINITDSHSMFFEGTYASSKTRTKLEPFPLASDDILGGTGGQVPAESFVNGVPVRNPFVPQYLWDRISDTDGDGLRDFYFTRRMSDIAARGNSAERDTFRVLAGFKGEINKTWSYETFAAYGSTKENQTSTGQINVLAMRYALDAVTDSFGKPICADVNARAAGCVPINIHGRNTISPEAARYVAAPGSLSTLVSQKTAGVSVSGEPFMVPAGAVGVAFGAEYREETSKTEFDALTQSGLNAGNALPNTAGAFNVKEFFAEVRVPLLKDLPLIKSLDATAAVRRGDYSSVGGATSWNTGLDWAANSKIRVRATTSVSTRAPNIGDLYQARSQTFPTGLVDPCLNVTATGTDAKSVNCRAAPGVNANIAANGGMFDLTQADLQGTSGYDSGNPNLQAEKGKSATLGVVFTPAKNMAFTADYFDIKIDEAINSPGRQFALDQCYVSGNPTYCKVITRRPTAIGANSAGSLSFIDDIPANSGGQVARGVDLTAAYSEALFGGRASAKLSWTVLIEAWNKATDIAPIDSSMGEIGSPKNKWVLNLGYDIGKVGLRATTTYIGESFLNDTFMRSKGFDYQAGKVNAVTYLDLQTTYKAGKAEFYFGLDNALDTKPAPIISGLPGNSTGTETAASVYDPIGRRYYFGLRYSL